MEEPLSRMFIMIPVSMGLVVLVVALHYEFMHRISALLKKLELRSRPHMILTVLGIFLGHVIEVWIFALVFFLFSRTGKFGSIEGTLWGGGDIFNYVYYSASSYTSLGFGDLVPVGPLRFLTAVETLTGLILIAWSASFAFIHMQKLWKD